MTDPQSTAEAHELPPLDDYLPKSGRWTTAIAIKAMQDYARAALESQLQPKGTEAKAIGYMNAGQLLELSRGGTPYGYVYPEEGPGARTPVYVAPQAPAPAPRPFTAVKTFADSVLAMLDERIKAVDKAAHPFNDYFGDQPETIVAAKAQAGELREVRTQVRILGDRALVDLMKFKPAIPAPEGADERPAFERWMSHQASPLHLYGLGRDDEDRYGVAIVQAAWWAWQARAALAAPAPQAPVALTNERLTTLLFDFASSWVIGSPEDRKQALQAIREAVGTPAPQTKEPTNDR